MQLATVHPFKSVFSSVLNQQPTALPHLLGLKIKGRDWKDFFVFLRADYINCICIFWINFSLYTKAIEAFFLLGYFLLSSRKLCALRSWLLSLCDSVLLHFGACSKNDSWKQTKWAECLGSPSWQTTPLHFFFFFFSLQVRQIFKNQWWKFSTGVV